MVRNWIAGIGRKLANNKTDVLLISNRKKMELITITVGDQSITSKWAIKYLGLTIYNRKCAATMSLEDSQLLACKAIKKIHDTKRQTKMHT